LQPWKEYESFSWKREGEDSAELGLVSKSWPGGTTRLIVPLEESEAARRVLEANLVDLSLEKATCCKNS
jgi:hypothetical protein